MMRASFLLNSRSTIAVFRQSYQYSTSTVSEEKIEIPKRISRNATDILRALEQTVGRDPTAAHYKYHDDPYLIPMSNAGKRTFAMAQEAGRKAAHWIRREHADLFQHKEADPPIEAFIPPLIYNDKSQVTEADLKRSIKNVQVSDARLIYKLLKDRNIKVSQETVQSLLELVCYQNAEDALSEEFIEERWFRQSNKAKEKQRKTWKDGDLAEEIFIELETPTAEAYSAIIQGMTKYRQVDRAVQLFQEAQEKNLILNTETYNSLINVTHFIKEDYNMRWQYVVDLLMQMKQNRLKPNLGTLNAILHCLSTMGGNQFTRQQILRTLAEFKKIGIEPCLASWYYVLIVYCRERGPISTILYDIMEQIENKEHTIQDLKDTSFFVTAMDICRNHLNDVELGRRVHQLLNYKNNYDLIGDSYKESIYFRHYFALLCSNLPLEEFMNGVYYQLVPHIYVPEPGVMGELLDQIEINGAVEYVPKLWSDIIIFDHTQREHIIESIINIMINNEQSTNIELNEKFATISWDIYSRLDNQNENKINKISLTGDLIGKIIMLLLRGNEFEKACNLMERLDKDHQFIVGVPKFEALSLFVDHCIENKSPSRAINCIQYTADSGYNEANILAARLNDKLTLNEMHLSRLSSIIGDVNFVKIKLDN